MLGSETEDKIKIFQQRQEKVNQAFQYFKKAADQGHADSQFNVGVFYQQGIGTLKDANQAFQYFKKAADQGHAGAQFNVGVFYQQGIGTPKDANQAFQYFKKAADQGHADSQFNVGVFYRQGICTPKDANQAFQYFKKAADQGHAGAQCNVGVFYQQGIGTPKDANQAFQYFKKAADQGHAGAQCNVGVSYQRGIGAIKDENVGLIYLQKAAQRGHREAQYWINKKITVDPSVILEKAKKSRHCFIPKKFPSRVSQVGTYCGYAAFAGACNYARQLPEPLYASLYEKQAAGKPLDAENKDVLLEQLKNTRYPSEGPQYNIHAFSDLAKYYKIENCEAITINVNCTKEEYTNILCKAFEDNYVLILPCDTMGEMPVANKGNSTHWVLGFGFHYDKNDECQIVYTHHDLICESDQFYDSNKQLPEKNPRVENGSLKDFRMTFFKVKVEVEREILQQLGLLILKA